jgi:hypothetical protein
VAVGAGGAAVEVRAEVVGSRSATAGGGKGEAYTVFVLRCQGGGVVWDVSRRYSEFAELHLKLLSLLPAAKGESSANADYIIRLDSPLQYHDVCARARVRVFVCVSVCVCVCCLVCYRDWH